MSKNSTVSLQPPIRACRQETILLQACTAVFALNVKRRFISGTVLIGILRPTNQRIVTLRMIKEPADKRSNYPRALM